MPPGFRHPGRALRTGYEMWAPSGYRALPFQPLDRTRGSLMLSGAIAKLKPGASVDEARRRLDAFSARLRTEHPTVYSAAAGWSPRLIPLHDDVVGTTATVLIVMLAATVDYQGSNVKASRLTVGLLLLFVGEVNLLGIISVGLRLGLEAQYSPGGGLKGRGFVSVSIKICWCITIDVQADVEYTFGGAGASRSAARALRSGAISGLDAPFDYGVPARAYILMFA